MTDRLFTETLAAAVGEDLLSTRLSSDFVFADIGADAVRPLLTFADLNHILATAALEPPRLRLHRKGAPVPVARYTEAAETSQAARRVVDPEALYRELRDGASLVLDGIDRLHPPIRAATDDLMRLVRERAQVNLYLIWGDSHGFDTHWDDHDTFIVQIQGTKSWQVHGHGSRPYPMKVDADHGHTPPEGVLWEGVLRPGQVLHVPRGWWHTVKGTGDVSMHLTFGFTRATGVDWAQALLERLYDVEVFRHDLPRFASPDERAKHQHELVRHLIDLAGGHDLDAFLDERDARFPRRQSFSLPEAVDGTVPGADTVVEFVPIIAPRLERTESAAGDGAKGAVTVRVSGRRYRFPAAAEPVLEAFVRGHESGDAGRTLTIGALAEAASVPVETAAGVVRALVKHQLAVIR